MISLVFTAALTIQSAFASPYEIDFLFSGASEDVAFDTKFLYDHATGPIREIGFYSCKLTDETYTTCVRTNHNGVSVIVTVPTAFDATTGLTRMNFGAFINGDILGAQVYSNTYDAANCPHCGGPLPDDDPNGGFSGGSATVTCKTPPGGPGTATCSCSSPTPMHCTAGGCNGKPPACNCTTIAGCNVGGGGSGFHLPILDPILPP